MFLYHSLIAHCLSHRDYRTLKCVYVYVRVSLAAPPSLPHPSWQKEREGEEDVGESVACVYVSSERVCLCVYNICLIV